jgi:hypothetical protein
MEFENQELAEWLEDTVRKIMEEKADGIIFVAQMKDGGVLTSYFHAGPCRKVELASHIQIDAVLEAMKMKEDLDETKDSEEGN